MAHDRMSGRIGLVVSDVDGTLVRKDKSLSDAVIAAARRLRDGGVPMTLISARPPSGMLWIAERLELTAPIGAFNGGTIVKPDGTIVSAERLDGRVARRALDLIDRPGVIIWLFHAGVWHAARLDDEYAPRERKSANQEPVTGSDFSMLLDRVDKIVAVSDDHAMLAELDAQVAEALGTAATVGRSQTYYLDITAPGANKGAGIAALAEAIGVPLAEVAAIGDQRNDMAMFARAGLSIAMAQGPEEVRAAADRTTRSNDDDGVAAAIDEIILPAART